MREDRHGRAAHGDTDRRRRPSDGFRVHGPRRFGQLVEDALTSLPAALLEAAGDAQVAVEDLPPPDTAARDVPLARFEPGAPARLVVYRRPLELRALSHADLTELVRAAAGQEIARALGVEDEYGDWFDDDDW